MWPENRRGSNIPKRLGFVREGTLRSVSRDSAGRAYDVSVFALLRDDYECGKIPAASERAFDVTGQDLL